MSDHEKVSGQGKGDHGQTEGEEGTGDNPADDDSQTGRTRPFVLYDDDGEEVLRATISPKGYRKSLETGELWTIHTGTGRLLPLGGGVPFLSLVAGDEAVEATVDERVADALRHMEGGVVKDEASGASGGSSGNSGDPVGTGAGVELDELDRTVQARRTEGGEGSYTSYLFSQGESKIRKKLGEEAIELCLAEENGEIVSESADLLYHLSVFLAERGLSYADVMAELRRRRG